jgi:hypothetical protein
MTPDTLCVVAGLALSAGTLACGLWLHVLSTRFRRPGLARLSVATVVLAVLIFVAALVASPPGLVQR